MLIVLNMFYKVEKEINKKFQIKYIGYGVHEKNMVVGVVNTVLSHGKRQKKQWVTIINKKL